MSTPQAGLRHIGKERKPKKPEAKGINKFT
jgi:hypothetical protein